MHVPQTLQLLGLDPASESARRATALVAENGRWEYAGQRYFEGEVEPCINGPTIETGAYFGVDVARIVERILNERLEDGGWNCEVENGSVRSSFDEGVGPGDYPSNINCRSWLHSDRDHGWGDDKWQGD